MYQQAFFDTIRGGCRSSAEAVMPTVARLLAPRSVVDVGSGEGWWSTQLADLIGDEGVHIFGVDGPGVPDAAPIRTLGTFCEMDLTDGPGTEGSLHHFSTEYDFDLAISLEVAEHLPAERAETFVADLCSLAPVVLFSAAIPQQGGTNHVNCRWPAYWDRLFSDNGFLCDWSFRLRFWHDRAVEPWYRQNMMIAVSEQEAPPFVWERLDFDEFWSRPLALHHPECWIADMKPWLKGT